jgi:hypothetical protein
MTMHRLTGKIRHTNAPDQTVSLNLQGDDRDLARVSGELATYYGWESIRTKQLTPDRASVFNETQTPRQYRRTRARTRKEN